MVMSVSFHWYFDSFCNINEIVTAFWILNFSPLSLSCWAALNETERISKIIVFIWQIRKTIIRLEVPQSHLILSCAVQLDWWVKSCLYFCRNIWNHSLSWSFRRSILNNLFKNFSVVHLLYNEKVIKSRSEFAVMLWWGQINHNKIVWLRPGSLTQLFELFFHHFLRHVVVKNVINNFLVLRKQTKEICIFSNCLVGKIEIILT